MFTRPKKKCKHCRCLFHPDPRNHRRQQYCKKADCRKASKRASNRKWQSKPENRDYHKGQQAVERVRRWRAEHPEKARKRGKNMSSKREVLQEVLIPEPTENTKEIESISASVLQDVLNRQHLVIVGIIAKISGLVLQDSIEEEVQDLVKLGADLVNYPKEDFDEKASDRCIAVT